MTQKKPSYNALLRKIERLEAALEVEKAESEKAFRIYADNLSELVDLKMRAEQAMRLLSGEDA